MKKIHIVSNRLPYSIEEKGDDVSLIPSVGGLATGLKSVYKKYDGLWFGWPGIGNDPLSPKSQQQIEHLLTAEHCCPIKLNQQEVEHFYEGFSNKTIWPLFHYFPQYVNFSEEDWTTYCKVNQKFADAVLEQVEDGDAVWVHDYQFLLVPEMIKRKNPNILVGFFLHIPFPSYEIFRILPWRNEIINGMLGADLLGFHTYDYERHFFSCVRRLFGHEISFNHIFLENRIVLADVFPMGIDYKKFEMASHKIRSRTTREKSDFHKELEKYILTFPERKLILSIDRLDYSKGIPQRLIAFEHFLDKYPQFRKKVTLLMLAVPSRNNVDRYQDLKKEVDELVGRINGKFGSISYTPVWYFYRSLPFDNLVELYTSCDVALITPLRDGMNLVAKEYITSRMNNRGVIILSEMAGVAKEMGEAIIINPNDKNEVADAIFKALNMPAKRQEDKIISIKNRLKRYDVFKWANDFVSSLEEIEKHQNDFYAKLITDSLKDNILEQYQNANKRAIFLDYDGTLVGFKKNPQDAKPNNELLTILKQLTKNKKNSVIIISGRDRDTLENWFQGLDINLICEHGIWQKEINKKWQMIATVNNNWMPNLRPILEKYVDRTPGSFIEEKNYSLVWHYRNAEIEQAELRANSLKEELSAFTSNHNLEVMEGNKVIEVKVGGFNKGVALQRFIRDKNFDFVLATGDDWTDEFMFREAPKKAITIKVGMNNTLADYKVNSYKSIIELLEQM